MMNRRTLVGLASAATSALVLWACGIDDTSNFMGGWDPYNSYNPYGSDPYFPDDPYSPYGCNPYSPYGNIPYQNDWYYDVGGDHEARANSRALPKSRLSRLVFERLTNFTA